MNQQQQTFHDFIMQRVQPGNEAQAEALLTQAFAQQDSGSFDREGMEAGFSQLKTLLKPEAVADLGQAFAQMRAQMHDGHEFIGGHGPDHEHGPGDGHQHGPGDGHEHMHGPGDWHEHMPAGSDFFKPADASDQATATPAQQ